MNKILQLTQAIGCLYEMEPRQKCLRDLQWLEAIFEFWIGGLLFFILLAVSICIGDATIPSYLGDGYSYDNFGLHCYIGNNGKTVNGISAGNF